MKVLMVAEKPSLAESLSGILSNNRASRRDGILKCHEWSGTFQGKPARFNFTAVMGHVYSIDFPDEFNSWDHVSPVDLFRAPTVRSAGKMEKVVSHLKREGSGVDAVVLWLDCDREGENICFEVLKVVGSVMTAKPKLGHNVFRAKFSAITASEIKAAFDNLSIPNEAESNAVDVRQELDLKVGIAFTRFQTKYFQGSYGDLDAGVVSYGPCQTPTLGFCVDRHFEIQHFVPEPFWSISACLQNRFSMEWERGRVFDRSVAELFLSVVKEGAAEAKVVSVENSESRKQRPPGLNTVELLKVCSKSFGIAPQATMHIAERLYIQGLISYPRTESTKYSPSTNLNEAVSNVHGGTYSKYTSQLLSSKIECPKGGKDAGDHPPITPQRLSGGQLSGQDFLVYDYVLRHFLASLLPDARYQTAKVVVKVESETFVYRGKQVLSPGWTALLKGQSDELTEMPNVLPGSTVRLTGVDIKAGNTAPPEYLTESDLIDKMEQNGIGTDASIPVHINTITNRNYVAIEGSNRLVIPSTLGICLAKGYHIIDPELVLPTIRSYVEQQLTNIATGKADPDAVLAHILNTFKEKFLYFVANVKKMDALFSAHFSPLAETGKAYSRCGKCRRFLNFIEQRPQRLHCMTCNETYNLPPIGTVKLYNENKCPLDGFQLLLHCTSKETPLCPCCYNNPPFEDIGPGMACCHCPHPTCEYSLASNAVATCPECPTGYLAVNSAAAKLRMECNNCNVVVSLPSAASSVTVSKTVCDDCHAKKVIVRFSEQKTPHPLGLTKVKACVNCDSFLSQYCRAWWEGDLHFMHAEVKFSSRGRGRGGASRGSRGGRGRYI